MGMKGHRPSQDVDVSCLKSVQRMRPHADRPRDEDSCINTPATTTDKAEMATMHWTVSMPRTESEKRSDKGSRGVKNKQNRRDKEGDDVDVGAKTAASKTSMERRRQQDSRTAYL